MCPKGSEEFKKGSKEFKNMNMFCLSISSEEKIKGEKRICPVKYVENPTENTSACIHVKFRNYRKIEYNITKCKGKGPGKLRECCNKEPNLNCVGFD